MLARTAIHLVLLATAVAAPFGCLALVGLDENHALEPDDPTAADGGSSGPDSAGSPCADAECCTPADCPQPLDICTAPVCLGGHCDQRQINDGDHASWQVPGDCKVYLCTDGGTTTLIPDYLDKPDAGNPCEEFSCDGDGGVIRTPISTGTPCSHGDGSSGICSPSGECVPTSCNNGTQDVNESDLDCGGPCIGMCEAGDSCETPSDCISGMCTASICN